jgi:membrane protein required for colicin V production
VNWFDIVLLVIFAGSVFSGLRAGLVRVVIYSIAIVGGLLAGFAFYAVVGGMLLPWIASRPTANIAGFALILFGVMILGWLLGFILSRSFEWVGLGWLDHVLGGVAGLVRGALLVAVVITVAVAFTSNPLPTYLSESAILPYAASTSAALAQLAPKPLREGLEQTIERLRHWMKQSSKAQGAV